MTPTGPTGALPPAVARCVVVVPVHNEESGLPATLDALDLAARQVAVPVVVVVVLDACDDGSADVPGPGIDVRVIDAHSVGVARATGFAEFVPDASTWFATTDADSTVPADWLAGHLALADAGADAVVGTVVAADWADWPADAATVFASTYVQADGHRHVHGANLGVRASTYASVGGFAPLTHDEDVDLVRRITSGGGEIAWSAAAPVRTSTRATGRAPAGFASALGEMFGAFRTARAETAAPRVVSG